MTENAFLDSVLRLHQWRVNLNGENLGWGYDQYRPNEGYHYPEAYALFGRGYIKLFRATGEAGFLECAVRSADWLLKHTSPRYQGLSWGLPWPSEYWKAPADLPYLVTTAFVGDFILETYLATGSDVYLRAGESISDWIIEENGYLEDASGVLFYYANHPPLKFPIYNPSALAIGFLGKLDALAPNATRTHLIQKGIRYIVNAQKPDGSWYYSSERSVVDNFHTSIVLEGLLHYLRQYPQDRSVRDCVVKGFEYYDKTFFSKSGTAREVLVRPTMRYGIGGLLRSSYALARSRLIGGPPARLWCYGGAIRVHAAAAELLRRDDFARIIAGYAIAGLQSNDGSFAFRKGDTSVYIRNEAHIFDGLATLLASS